MNKKKLKQQKVKKISLLENIILEIVLFLFVIGILMPLAVTGFISYNLKWFFSKF